MASAACALGPGPAPARGAPQEPEPVRAADDRPADAPQAPAVYLFLRNPADLGGLWKSLATPDVVVLDGKEYDRLRSLSRATGKPGGPAVPWAYSVDSVAVAGDAGGDLARLDVDYGVTLATDGPVWVALRLDGATLNGAAEEGEARELRASESSGWQVRLSGRGAHKVRVGLLTPVRTSGETKRVEVATPEAASTSVSVVVDGRAASAEAGEGEPVSRDAVGEGDAAKTRLAADLSPRPRLAVSWTTEDDPGASLPPLLVTKGEIAVDADHGSFRTQSSWSIRSVRGTARSLELGLDPRDEVLELTLDDQSPPAGLERVGGEVRMTIPLAEPLAPGAEHRLKLATRRPVPVSGPFRVVFNGFPLKNAREQMGAIGVALAGNLWATGTARRGLRQIDPRTELPADLRARPATALAYQFSEQPFELALGFEPSPPLVRAEGRTTVWLEPGLARLEADLDFTTTRGRLIDLQFAVPTGLEVESVGPADVVAGWQLGPLPSAVVVDANPGGRLLTARLATRVNEGGQFTVRVAGRATFPAAERDVNVGLVQPLASVNAGGRLAVYADPSLSVELPERTGGGAAAGAFRPAVQPIPSDWPWPPDRNPAASPLLWLRYDGNPAALPLRATAHEKSVGETTSLQVQVDRGELVVRQDSELSVRFGSLDTLDVTIPAPLARRWEVDGVAPGVRPVVRETPGGGQVVRLRPQPEPGRPPRLQFRYRLPLDRPTAGRPVDVEVPRVRFVGAAAAKGLRASVAADPGLDVEALGNGWSAAEPEGASPAAGLVVARDVASADPGDLRLRLRPKTLAGLPGTVVPRLALRTVQAPDGGLRTTAWYWVESHEASLSVALPAGARLQQVRVAGEAFREVEERPGSRGYLLRFPARVGSSPTSVELEYAVPAEAAGGRWEPPRLTDGAVVQQTDWEVRIPWSRALVGVPDGWADENGWFWAGYVWQRRPWTPWARLRAGPGGAPAADDPGPAGSDPRGDDHGYLFGRPSGPEPLGVTVAPRALLVGLCSGSVLLLGGLLILVWKPPVKLVWSVLAALAFASAVLWHPSVTFLAAQSSAIGAALTALLALMHWGFERRNPGAPGASRPRSSVLNPPSTLSRTVGAGSDDSTAIRPRVSPATSTLDHVPVSPPSFPVEGEADEDADGLETETRIGNAIRQGPLP